MIKRLEGLTFGRLRVISFSHIDPIKRAAVWNCICECGNKHLAKGTHLRSGEVKSCGCLHKDSMSKLIPASFQDLSGQTFGRLLVIKRSDKKSKNHVLWICKCICGVEKIVSSQNLKTGRQLSCGCLNREKAILNHTTHGQSTSRLYRIWSGILTRCYNPKCKGFKYYGGRGITMSDKWKNNFMEFFNDMHEGYKKGLHIDRIDVEGNYEKANCRWITPKENSRNKRSNLYLIIGGIKKLAIEWAEQYGKSYTGVHRRIKKGYSDEQALFGKKYSPYE